MTVPGATDRESVRRKRRPYLWTAGAIALSLALVALAWWVDQRRAPDGRQARTRRGPVAELVGPSPLSDRERSGTGPSFGSQESVKLEQGAWIQVADAKGNLKQQYTASRIDPLPDKRVAMKDPRAVLYSDGGRIITMRSDAMTARIPRRALESGKLDGNVVIRIYRSVGGRPVDLVKDAPDVVVESPEAQFDAASGEIRCDRRVRITGNALDFDGEGLSLSLAPDGKTIDRLVVDRALAPVRFNRTVAAAQAAERKKAAGAVPAPAAAADAGGAKAAGGVTAAANPRRPASEASRLFLLTLLDDVSIVSLEAGRRTEVTGDRLDAYFMLSGGSAKGLAAVDPFGPAPARADAEVAGLAPGPRAVQVLSAAFASANEDTVEVRFAGRLVMAPAPEGTPDLSDPSAVRVVVSGAPARITDSRSEAVITAQRATFESGAERVELLGDAKAPATVTSPRFGLVAQRFQLDRSTGIGGSEGPGSITVGGAGAKPLTVAWAKGMRVALAPAKGGDTDGSLRAAEFDGDVRASSKDFELEAGHLAIESQPAGKKDCPRRIEATGGVRAKSLGRTGGRFAAQRVEVTLGPDAAGDAQARTLLATGDVMAADASQTMWASTLRLSFVDRPKVRGGGEKADEALGADVGAIVAEGPIELRMQDGTRVWATRLEGDGRQRTARLVGPELLVVRANLVLDQLNEITVQDSPARLSSVGPGRASGFKDRVVTDSDARLGRPQVKGVPQMQATWRDSLAFADQAVKPRDGGAARGLLLLQGTVKVRASRDAREAEAMDADEIQVEFLPGGAKVAAAPAGKRGAGTGAGAGADAAVQRMGTMRAVGNVRLEARQWVDGRREGQPKLFRMTAPNVAYDGASGGIAVDGAGSLLVFDPGKPRTPAQADEAKSPFSPDGTTRFTWKRSLGVERRPDGTSRVVLERDVVMEHLGASDATTGTVTADRMTAVVRGVEGVEPARAGDVGMSLGGPAELVSVFADGRVVVRTADIDVDGGEFELDVKRQIGAIRAPVGRLVTVVRHGTPAPARAHAFTWDLVKGSFSVEGARGTVGR